MENRKRTFIVLLVLGLTLIGAYIFFSYLEKEMACNLISIVNAAAGTGMLLYGYYLSSFKKSIGRVLLLYALGCFFWMLGDIFWLMAHLRGRDPGESLAGIYAYTGTNIFLFSAVLLFIYYQFKKWKSMQLVLDAVTLAVMSAFLVWITFFHKDTGWATLLLQDGWSSALSIVLDFLICFGLLVMFYFIKNSRIPLYILLMSMGVASFSLADLYYYYVYANAQYIPNSILDVVYIASFLPIALGGLWKPLLHEDTLFVISPAKTAGKTWYLLFLFPLTAFLVEGFHASDFFHFILIIAMYKISSDQVRSASAKEDLYRKEMEINLLLEKRVEEQYGELVFLANHDAVTQLKNRRYFVKSLDEALQEAAHGETVAVFFVDLDRFKIINDTLGHDVGDKVLIEISRRMQDCCQDHGVLARLGGDEFAVFLKGWYSRSEVSRVAGEIIDACSKTILVKEHKLHVTISLGIAFYPHDADNRIALMRNADVAMYRAKAQGYNRYVFYDPFFVESIGKKGEIEVMLRKANMEQDFELYYQPQFDMLEDRLIGAEALISWKSSEYGYISPEEFIPVAEEINYIIQIGKWVMNEAINQIIQWNTTHDINLKMGINISPKQLQDDEFLGILKNLIDRESFCSAWIDAEITENVLMESDNRINGIFEELKGMQVSVSVDDFGSGYSSLGYLNKFPFDRIKIDQSLIRELAEENTNATQVRKAIISMAEAMGIGVIAEGVETAEQFDILKSLGCPQGQGFYLGRPVSAKEFEEMFIRNHS